MSDKIFLKRTPQELGPDLESWLQSILTHTNTPHCYVNLDSWNWAWDPELMRTTQCFDTHAEVGRQFRHLTNIHQIFATGATVIQHDRTELQRRDFLNMYDVTLFEMWPAYTLGNLDLTSQLNHNFCDIVTEPEVTVMQYTLNTIKSICYQRPFVIASAPGMNTRLRVLGFELFDELFDYDLEPQSVSDISEAQTWHTEFLRPLDTLTDSDRSELGRLWQPKCRHNLQRLKHIVLAGELIPDIIKSELLTGAPGFDNYYEIIQSTRQVLKTHELFRDI